MIVPSNGCAGVLAPPQPGGSQETKYKTGGSAPPDLGWLTFPGGYVARSFGVGGRPLVGVLARFQRSSRRRDFGRNLGDRAAFGAAGSTGFPIGSAAEHEPAVTGLTRPFEPEWLDQGVELRARNTELGGQLAGGAVGLPVELIGFRRQAV